MIVFIILVFIQSAILDCDEFIPPALQFDDSIYFDNTSKSNIIFIDYQQLIIYDLCYNNEIKIFDRNIISNVFFYIFK